MMKIIPQIYRLTRPSIWRIRSTHRQQIINMMFMLKSIFFPFHQLFCMKMTIATISVYKIISISHINRNYTENKEILLLFTYYYYHFLFVNDDDDESLNDIRRKKKWFIVWWNEAAETGVLIIRIRTS